MTIHLHSSKYDAVLASVFGYTDITDVVFVGDQPQQYIDRLLIALDFIDPFGYSIEVQ